MSNRKFRVKLMRNNDYVYFINIDNSDEFYIYDGDITRQLTNSKIFKEENLTIKGRYVISFKI